MSDWDEDQPFLPALTVYEKKKVGPIGFVRFVKKPAQKPKPRPASKPMKRPARRK